MRSSSLREWAGRLELRALISRHFRGRRMVKVGCSQAARRAKVLSSGLREIGRY